MRNQLILLFLCFQLLQGKAQQVSDSSSRPKPMSWKEVATWKSISNFSVNISPDGKWVAYPMLGREVDGDLIVKKVKDTVLRKYPIGSTLSASFDFSDDGKWFAYKEYPKFKEAKAVAKNPGKQLFEKLILVELATGKKTEFEKVGGYAFNGKTSTYLALTLMKEKSGPPAKDEAKGNDLLIVELSTGKTQNIGNVGEYAFNKAGSLLAYTVDAAGKTGNGLYILDLFDRQTSVLDNDKVTYKSLNWNEKGDALAILKLTKDEKYKVEKGEVLAVKNFSAASPTIVSYSPAKDSLSFPKGMTISANRSPSWSGDLSRIFFGISELTLVKKDDPVSALTGTDTSKAAKELASKNADIDKLEKIKADTSIKSLSDLKKALAKMDSTKSKTDGKMVAATDDVTKPDMAIWHGSDKRLQSRQQVQETQDKNYAYWGEYDVAAKKFIQLNDSSIRDFRLLPEQHYAIAFDQRTYELDINLNGQNYTDIYIIDLKTGVKSLFMKDYYGSGFNASPRPSPDGNKFTYGQNGNYYVYDIPSKTSVNITGKAATSFIDTEDDHNIKMPLTDMIDWSSDSKYVLIADLWDIWQLSANGKETPVNLTLNGKASKIRYQTRYTLDREEKGIDLKKANYVRMYGEWNKKSGIGRIEPGTKGLKPGVRNLIWDDIAVGQLQKADHANAFLFSKEKFSEPTEFFVGDESLSSAEQVTINTPDLKKFVWSPGVQLVNYVSDKGDSLQGTLFLPAGYEKGKKYPTIVYYYEKLSQTANSYVKPDYPSGGWNPALYTSNGYAVFMPDIVYKMDDPGMSTVWCVLPAVKAALQTGVIDETKMGITGHSWGGYQTAFLVTQTSIFKAAAAGAALTNMISMYDLIYWNSGGGNMAIFEASQGRFKGAPWENWDSYLRNSPIYHVKKVTTPLLMLHNDKDGAVDFTQGIEFYSALRRLKKPVILIQYKGENHGLAKLENRKDYAVRMMEFFDYHLKGKPAPDWMVDGVDRLKLEEHLEKRAF